ncbi:hypothetical protein I4U23_005666 [Adineta vaga]|nr:hypothetical protein I4U23_005666 [Adineta vaga]
MKTNSKRCHGNRKLQHFKRKCRTRGLTEEQIITLIQTKHDTISEQLPNDHSTINDHLKQSTKRKRDQSQQNLISISMKSLSQLSLSHQNASKKKKKSSQHTNSSNNHNDDSSDNNNNNNNNTIILYKSSKYLRPRKLLLHLLRLQLNHKINKRKEQHFILEHLQLLDPQFCIDQIRYLYQTYVDCGSRFYIWPVNKVDKCTTELTDQSLTCPSSLSLLEIIDLQLKEFVRLHHIDLMRTVRYQVHKFKDEIHEKELFKQLSYYYLNTDQFQVITRLTSIRQKQLEVFEELTMFEQRVLCHQLPESLDTVISNVDLQQLTKRRYKMLQELKRVTLDAKLREYEQQIQDYEHLYQEDLISLQYQIQNPSSSNYKHQINILMYFLQSYLNHYTQKLMRKIRFKEACLHVKLTRHRRRHQQSFLPQNIINVYPQTIVDVKKIALNRTQLEYLSQNGPSYIRPNQSYLHCYERRKKQIEREYNNILDVIVPYLMRSHHMKPTSTVIKQLSHQLAKKFRLYSEPSGQVCFWQGYAPFCFIGSGCPTHTTNMETSKFGDGAYCWIGVKFYCCV